MSELPKNWCAVEIEQVLQPLDNGKVIQQGWSPQCEKEPASLEEWGVLKTTAIQEGYFLPEENKKLPSALEARPAIEVKPGDILMTCAGPRNRCGVTSFVKETRPRLMMSGKMYRFRADQHKIDPSYLEAFLLSQDAKVAIDRMKTGINDSGLNLTHSRFLKLNIPLAPLNEQKRVVRKIEELFSKLNNGIENLKNARAQLRIYRHAIFKHAFEGKLTHEWRIKNKAAIEPVSKLLCRVNDNRTSHYNSRMEEYKITLKHWQSQQKKGKPPNKPRKDPEITPHIDEFKDLPVLPKEWMWVLLAQLSHHIVDGTHKTPRYVQEGVPFISAKDINNFRISFEDTRYITQDEHEELIKRCQPKKGCVLITKSGTIGRVAVVKTDAAFSLFESVANVPVIEPINSDYIAYISYLSATGAFGATKQKGVAVRHLHLEDLRRIPIPLPPIEEQKQIIMLLNEAISVIENLENEIDAQLQKSEVLRQSILKKAFSGQLVAQDAKDEPASALLSRIRAEKEKGKEKQQSKTKKSAA